MFRAPYQKPFDLQNCSQPRALSFICIFPGTRLAWAYGLRITDYSTEYLLYIRPSGLLALTTVESAFACRRKNDPINRVETYHPSSIHPSIISSTIPRLSSLEPILVRALAAAYPRRLVS